MKRTKIKTYHKASEFFFTYAKYFKTVSGTCVYIHENNEWEPMTQVKTCIRRVA